MTSVSTRLKFLIAMFLQVLGVASLASDSVKFIDFFSNILQHYQNVREAIFSFLTFPFVETVPTYIQDYLIVASVTIFACANKRYFESSSTKSMKQRVGVLIEEIEKKANAPHSEQEDDDDFFFEEIWKRRNAEKEELENAKSALSRFFIKTRILARKIFPKFRRWTIESFKLVCIGLFWPITIFYSITSIGIFSTKMAYSHLKSYLEKNQGECGKLVCPLVVAGERNRMIDRLAYAASVGTVFAGSVLLLFVFVDFSGELSHWMASQ